MPQLQFGPVTAKPCGLAIWEGVHLFSVLAAGVGQRVLLGVLLALISPHEQKSAVDKVSWSTVLLVGGVITYIGVLQRSGAIDAVGQGVSGIGAPLLAALLLCYIGGVVSAFASSVGVLGATIPLAVPFLQQGEIGAVGMIAALAVSSTVVDVSPFSTNGALVVANAQP